MIQCLILMLGVVAISACAQTANRPPSVRLATIAPSVHGSLSPAQIQARIEQTMPDLETLAGKHWPGAGKMQVSFVVQPDGMADSVTLVRSDFSDPQLDKALTTFVSRISFPTAKSATYVKAYPVYFE